ncbi:BLOC-1-related complex subunit 8 homolog [Planococcus citri]|uniref:BLOC-1-related complex subunit 8 homolog n=1 Tax=Planococcus citri TaxID=170843 RepID=UPI0031F8CA91
MSKGGKGNKGLDTIIIDPVLEEKVRKAKERISENMHILANEPSLAYYRLQENIRKSLPHMVDKRIEAEKLQKDLQGNIYDLEYAINELTAMGKTQETFKNILELSKTALFMKQQVKYLKTKRNKKDPSSVYKRFSAHITLDLPDLPDALKETANKVESMMGNSRHSTMY